MHNHLLPLEVYKDLVVRAGGHSRLSAIVLRACRDSTGYEPENWSQFIINEAANALGSGVTSPPSSMPSSESSACASAPTRAEPGGASAEDPSP